MAPSDRATPELLLAHSAWLRRLARQLVQDGAEADDAVQETWVRVLERGGDTPLSPRAWLAGVLRHVVANRSRGEGRSRDRERARALEGPAAARESDPVEGLIAVERQRALLDLVLALPEEQRRALLLRYFEDLPPRAIAAREGTSVHTIKSRLQRGLARLREELESRHGGGSPWAAWLLPLARGTRGTAGGFSALGAGLALATIAVALTLALAHRSPSKQAALVDPSTAWGAQSSAGDTAALRQPPVGERSPAAPTAAGELLVRVVDERTGAPVAGALVLAAKPSDYDASLYPDIERVCLERGTRAGTDAGGLARLQGPGPWLVHASHGSLVRLAGAESGATELVVALRHVAPLRVRVVDEQGEPQAGVPVGGGHGLPDDIYSPGPDTGWWGLQRTTDASGEATFHDPMGSHSEPELPPAGARKRWRDVYVDLPGFAGRSSKARVRAPEPGDEPVVLVLGPAGELEVRVLDAAGAPSAVAGWARLTTQSAGSAFHDAPLVDGRARWPRIAPGGVYSVRVVLPEEGAEWSLEGPGPAAGAVAVLEARRPLRRALVAELVDAAGEPVIAGPRAMLYVPGERSAHSRGRFSTDGSGRLRVELDETLEALAASGKGWLLAVHWDSEMWFAHGSFPTPLAAGDISLGKLRLVPRPVVRGLCVGPDGLPLPGVHVSAMQLNGDGAGTNSDEGGRFALSGFFDGRVRLAAQDYEGGWFLAQPLEVAVGGEEVQVELVRSGEVRARLAPGAPASLAGQLHGTLRGPAGLHGRVDADGELRFGKVLPGTYVLEVRLGSHEGPALAAFEGIAVQAGRETIERRLERLDAGSLVREVRVRALALEKLSTLELTLLHEGGSVARLRLHDGRIPLPRGQAARLLVGARGKRTLDLGLIHALPDELEVALEPGLRVELRAVGRLTKRGTLSLVCDGHPLLNVTPRLDGLERGKTLQLLLPAPGAYRILRDDAVESEASIQSVRLAEALGSTSGLGFTVADVEDLQVFEIDLGRVR